MCGRFSFVVEKKKVQKALPTVTIESELAISYNIAPTQSAYVLTNTEPNILQKMAWGLIPHWAKDNKNAASNINARMETLVEKPSFEKPIRTQRCIILADSFYEWKTEGKNKIPYRILLKEGELLLLAGIWDEWQGTKTFSIITTQPNAEMSVLHNRMPVILSKGMKGDDWTNWLGETDLDTLLYMCEKPQDDFLKMYRVSEKVNSVRHDSADLHNERLPDLTLF
jgi:putative SOS response-associated peptidase YedK